MIDITPGSVVVEFLVHPSARAGDNRNAAWSILESRCLAPAALEWCRICNAPKLPGHADFTGNAAPHCIGGSMAATAHVGLLEGGVAPS